MPISTARRSASTARCAWRRAEGILSIAAPCGSNGRDCDPGRHRVLSPLFRDVRRLDAPSFRGGGVEETRPAQAIRHRRLSDGRYAGAFFVPRASATTSSSRRASRRSAIRASTSSTRCSSRARRARNWRSRRGRRASGSAAHPHDPARLKSQPIPSLVAARLLGEPGQAWPLGKRRRNCEREPDRRGSRRSTFRR